MKNKLILLIMGLMIISPFNTYATDYKYLEDGKYTGFIYNNVLKLDVYYKDGKIMKNYWVTNNNTGKTYYYKDDYGRATGWTKIDNSWYNFDAVMGDMYIGWWCDRATSTWYYFDSTGKMSTGWKEINSKWYYFNSNGAMQHDTTIQGYKLSSDGAWIQ